MRKADYDLLASLIKVMLTYDDETTRKMRVFAVTFAKNASVDRAQFLKACGID